MDMRYQKKHGGLYSKPAWQQLRAITFRRDHYICKMCNQHCNAPHCAHIKDYKGDLELFFDADLMSELPYNKNEIKATSNGF